VDGRWAKAAPENILILWLAFGTPLRRHFVRILFSSLINLKLFSRHRKGAPLVWRNHGVLGGGPGTTGKFKIAARASAVERRQPFQAAGDERGVHWNEIMETRI